MVKTWAQENLSYCLSSTCWVSVSETNNRCFKTCVINTERRVVRHSLLCVSHSVMSPQAIARQAPLSMEFSRQEYWSGLPFPSPQDLPNPGIEPASFLHCRQILYCLSHEGSSIHYYTSPRNVKDKDVACSITRGLLSLVKSSAFLYFSSCYQEPLCSFWIMSVCILWILWFLIQQNNQNFKMPLAIPQNLLVYVMHINSISDFILFSFSCLLHRWISKVIYAFTL